MILDINDCLRFAIEPALYLLPPKMSSFEARVMLVAIALQESRLEYRHQRGGPARGYWQFEEGGGVAGVLSHPSTAKLAREIAERLDYPATTYRVHEALEDNDLLAAVFARLNLWWLPQPLPSSRDDHDSAWDQYIEAWRPGHERPETWVRFYQIAWDRVTQWEKEGL